MEIIEIQIFFFDMVAVIRAVLFTLKLKIKTFTFKKKKKKQSFNVLLSWMDYRHRFNGSKGLLLEVCVLRGQSLHYPTMSVIV